jgi:predicted metalloenzyme YecM
MSDLKYDPINYRIHNDKNKRIIRKSLEECGAGRSVLVDNRKFIELKATIQELENVIDIAESMLNQEE